MGHGDIPTYQAEIGSLRLQIAITGMGPEAAIAAAAVIFRDKPDLCIVSGLAGGLDEALSVADVIVPRRVCGPDRSSVAGDQSALELALGCGAQQISMLYSAPTIIATAAEKRQFSSIAEAVDMESRTLLGESQQRNIPALAIRAISDTAAVDMPLDLNRAVSPRGDINPRRLLAALARRPHALPGLIRLGMNGYRAATALSVFLDTYMVQLAGTGERLSSRIKFSSEPT